MLAITVRPGVADSATLAEMPEPDPGDGAVLVRALALGVCGTDREILAAEYGRAPPGADRLILGHESLGEVIEAPAGCGLRPGDRVVGIVRRPDPVPCPACATGEWDMCRNGRYTERGIKERHGYGAERFRLEPDFAVKVDPALGLCGVLLEPASVVAKAWDHVDRIGRRDRAFRPRTVLVTGAGPIGLLAALLGRQRGLDVTVFDRNTEGPKPALVRALGAAHLAGDLAALEALAPDIIMECTGAVPVIAAVLGRTAPAGIVCLAGLSGVGRMGPVDIGLINRAMVLNNGVAFGTVNANRAHFETAAAALAQADRAWLAGLISRRVPLARWREALAPLPGDIKTVIEFASPA
ncbi:MAG: theronine dehydrogenase [Bradyrhizobiaceae bacterium]|nr:MAG: theronine dehydrogenase [Bradyrhizobiaceae bacterium]